MNLLITPKAWGPFADDQLDLVTGKHGAFFCGMCSTEDTKVYHNTLGQHCHITEARRKELVDIVTSKETKS